MDWQSKVLQWLRENDRSQAWLARTIAISPDYLNRCLNRRLSPSKAILEKIALAMGKPVTYLL